MGVLVLAISENPVGLTRRRISRLPSVPENSEVQIAPVAIDAIKLLDRGAWKLCLG